MTRHGYYEPCPTLGLVPSGSFPAQPFFGKTSKLVQDENIASQEIMNIASSRWKPHHSFDSTIVYEHSDELGTIINLTRDMLYTIYCAYGLDLDQSLQTDVFFSMFRFFASCFRSLQSFSIAPGSPAPVRPIVWAGLDGIRIWQSYQELIIC